MEYKVENKVFFVTGGASGIGAELVKMLVEEDAKLVVIFDFNETAGVDLERELNTKHGKKVQFIKGDVTKDDELVGSLKKIKEDVGLDVVVNNAGIMNEGWDIYKKEIEINETALITGTLHALELMRRDIGGNGGAILNVSSVAAIRPCTLFPIYSAAKAAVLQFSNTMGTNNYYSRTGVRVLAVCVGRTDTSLYQHFRSFDQLVDEEASARFQQFPSQNSQKAAQGLLQAYKRGSSGSTWLAAAGRPAQDISESIVEAYAIMIDALGERWGK